MTAGKGEPAEVVCTCPEHGKWYGADSIDKMVRELDVAMNGDGAAKQAMLCDIVGQIMDRLAALARAEALLAEAREKGQFLVDRLNELEWPDDASAVWREYAGHVEPALERFATLLAKLEQG